MMTMMSKLFVVVSYIQLLLYAKIQFVTFLSVLVLVIPLCNQQHQILPVVHAFHIPVSNINVHNFITIHRSKEQQQQQIYQYSTTIKTNKFSTFKLITNNRLRSRDDEEEEKQDYDETTYDIDDDIDDTIVPYKNRSLYWTENYRKLRPYSIVRASIIKLGIQSQQEWYEHVQDGTNCNPYIPTNPEIMYYDEWESWDEFLGIIRSYNDTKILLQSVLHIKNISQYNNFVQTNTQRAEGLRIPANPVLYYNTSIGNNTWISYDDFFGTSTSTTTTI